MKTLKTTAVAATFAIAATLTGCGSDKPAAGSTPTAPASSSAPSTDATTPVTTASTAEATKAVVDATTAFVATLTADQKLAVQFAWSDEAQKAKWSNLPEGLYDRSGVRWGDLSAASQKAWLAVMRATLSEAGYQQVVEEWHADDELASTDSGGGPGGNLQYGIDNYWIALIGTPSTNDAWQWQFGGHHITVNATLKAGNLSLTPSFIGAQPESYTAHGTKVEPLGDVVDASYALLSSLSDAQKSKVVLGSSFIDLILGPGQDGKTVQDEGISGADLTAEQQAMLLKLEGYYGNLASTAWSAARMAQLKADLSKTYFVWYGPTARGAGYFRVTGPHIVIEFSPQSMGGDAANHIHGIYRDPTNDYGKAFTG